MLKQVLPGVALCILVAAAGLYAASFPAVKDTLHLGPLLLVLVLAMILGGVLPVSAATQPGIKLCQKGILRLAVAGLGFRLSMQELWEIGWASLVVIFGSTAASFWFGWWVALKMGLQEKMAILLSVGTSICGASAIIAADSVVEGEEGEPAVALGVITLLGTIGIVTYPWFARTFDMSDNFYGVWTGATLHEMAQVVAAGFDVSDPAGKTATVAKLARILLLAPMVVFLGWHLGRKGEPGKRVSTVPWFLVAFLLIAILNSTPIIAAEARSLLVTADLWLLCVGMAGVGLQVRFREIARSGVKPIAAGVAGWAFLAAFAYGLAWFLL